MTSPNFPRHLLDKGPSMTRTHVSSEDIIIVDWGTTNLRAELVTPDGKQKAHFESDRGIQTIQDGSFEQVLTTALAPWLEGGATPKVIALGMITSKNGWVEVPYVPCPATPATLAAGTVRRTLPNGSDLIFLAGITDPKATPFPDVMRGEETQIVGFGLDAPAIVVLPGTHCKWAEIQTGRIERFQTFVTGEIFALLSKHSFIAKVSGTPNAGIDWDAFKKGVKMSLGTSGKSTSILNLLFSARTGMLSTQLRTDEIRDYISGVLIGYEFREARENGWFNAGDHIGIVRNDGLAALYTCAAKEFGLVTTDGGDAAAIAGTMAIISNL